MKAIMSQDKEAANQGNQMSLLSICVKSKLDSLPPPPKKRRFICKINEQLRTENQKAYEPEILSVGPYHYGKVNLQMMEENKLRYLNELLKRRNESVDRYIKAMEKWEEAARERYAERIELNKDKFMEMMLLDGCFIIELFRKYENPSLREAYDPIFNTPKIEKSIRRDLLLFENQIPFFVLSRLFSMTEKSNQRNPAHSLESLALEFFCETISKFPPPSYNHLLGLVHYNCYSSIAENRPSNDNRQFIKSVTELREAGIKFQKTESSSFLNVTFQNGIMTIPSLAVHDDTDCLFRNLIVYEQYDGGFGQTNMTDYMTFMDCLINSPKDVEILRRYEIIDNWLGDDTAVSTMFNKMGNHIGVDINSEKLYYGKVFDEVKEYCKHHLHSWMAFLRYNYCYNPWSIISVIVASVFLLLTMIQTGCSILQV